MHRVQLYRKQRDGSVSELNYWVATFNGVHSGRKGSRTFSVAKYGEQGAYELAMRARAELLEKFVDEHAWRRNTGYRAGRGGRHKNARLTQAKSLSVACSLA